MKKIVIAALAALAFSNTQAQIVKDVVNAVGNAVNNGNGLSNDDIISGLKSALEVGTNKSVSRASVVDGFFKNTQIKIPFPPEAKVVETYARKLKMTSQVNKFVLTLNRAAETAAKDAAPIFINAIKGMTISDGLQVLNGGNNAATNLLKQRTEVDLRSKFQPIVKNAISKVQLTQAWTPLASAYNKIPRVRKIDPNLEAYVTQKAIDGLFILIAQEETKIRQDPAARINDILKKVFGK